MHKRAQQDELFHKTFSFFFAQAKIAIYETPESENLHVDCAAVPYLLWRHMLNEWRSGYHSFNQF